VFLIALCGAMVVAVFLQVLFRYVFHFSLGWTEELARYAFTWLAMLGAAVAARRRSHFALEIVARALPARVAGALVIAASLVVLGFLLALAVQGARWTIAYSDMVSPAMQIGYYLVAASVPLSATLMSIEGVRQVASLLGRLRRGESPLPPAPGGPTAG